MASMHLQPRQMASMAGLCHKAPHKF